MHVIIVGGGLSGICLAHELEKHNISFKIIDKNVNQSTRVAGGMINPMTFRRLIKTWKGDEFIPTITKFYPEMEDKFEQRFFFPMKIRRVFASEDERNMWEERCKEEEYKMYISPIQLEEDTPAYINNTFGNAFVNTPGYIDSKRFIDGAHKYLLEKELLTYSTFDFNELDTENQSYKGEKYTHLIFAEGFEGEDNPYFGYLPFKNAKGETLTIKSRIIKDDEVINRKCFVLPTVDGDFKLGSTYSWGTKDASITEEAKEELVANYLNLSVAAMEITDHEGGIRPASMDRRPMIGEHPEKKGLYIFNGLGAKGFMIAPFYAIHFTNVLLNNETLDKEVSIERFYKRFYQN